MMCIARRTVATVAAASVVLCAAQNALGAESGTFKSAAILVNNFAGIDHAGGTAFAGSSTGVSLILESSGALFPVGESDQLDCVIQGKRSAAGTDLDASCTITGADDDALYLRARRRADGGGKGALEILGGTGKYAEMTGGCSYTVEQVGTNRQVTIADCTWQRPGE